MNIRPATRLDHTMVKALYLSAFPDSERRIVAQVALDILLAPPANALSLIAEHNKQVVGHVAFSQITLEQPPHTMPFKAYILAPLAVHPDKQKQQIGAQLVQQGIQTLSKADTDVILVYGDPNYYGRFGFNVDSATAFSAPYTLQYPAGWMALLLNTHCHLAEPQTIRCIEALNKPELW